jgi:hypothetical protein
MDKIRKRYGKDAVNRAAGMDFKSHDFNSFIGKKLNVDNKKK